MSTASRDDREAALRAATSAMRASQDRQDVTKDAALRTTLAALAADGRAALEARDAAEDARVPGRAREIARRREISEGRRHVAGGRARRGRANFRNGARLRGPRPVCKRCAAAQHAAAPPPRGRSWSCGGCSTRSALVRRDEAAWRAAGEERMRQRRLVAVATAMRRAHGGGAASGYRRRSRCGSRTSPSAPRTIAQRVALRVHGDAADLVDARR